MRDRHPCPGIRGLPGFDWMSVSLSPSSCDGAGGERGETRARPAGGRVRGTKRGSESGWIGDSSAQALGRLQNAGSDPFVRRGSALLAGRRSGAVVR